MLNLLHATRGVLPPSMDGDHGLIHKLRSAYPTLPKRSSLSVALLPSFHIMGPPHPWIFNPIRGSSTNNRIDEYAQRSMDGDYSRAACNRVKCVLLLCLQFLPRLRVSNFVVGEVKLLLQYKKEE